MQIAWQAWDIVRVYFRLYTPHSTLYTLHSTLHTLHSTLYTLHFTLYTLHLTLHTLHCTLHTLHSTLHTPHSTLYTLHIALYTSYFYTWHSTLHTLHFTLHTPDSTLCTLHFTFHTLHLTLHTLHFTLHTLHFTLHTLHFTLHTLHFPLYTWPSTLYTLHSTLTLYTRRSTTPTSHPTLCTPLHSTLHSLHWYGNRGRMYKTVEITCFTTVFYVTASLCVSTSVPSTYVWAFGFVGCILFDSMRHPMSQHFDSHINFDRSGRRSKSSTAHHVPHVVTGNFAEPIPDLKDTACCWIYIYIKYIHWQYLISQELSPLYPYEIYPRFAASNPPIFRLTQISGLYMVSESWWNGSSYAHKRVRNCFRICLYRFGYFFICCSVRFPCNLQHFGARSCHFNGIATFWSSNLSFPMIFATVWAQTIHVGGYFATRGHLGFV